METAAAPSLIRLEFDTTAPWGQAHQAIVRPKERCRPIAIAMPLSVVEKFDVLDVRVGQRSQFTKNGQHSIFSREFSHEEIAAIDPRLTSQRVVPLDDYDVVESVEDLVLEVVNMHGTHVEHTFRAVVIAEPTPEAVIEALPVVQSFDTETEDTEPIALEGRDAPAFSLGEPGTQR